MGLCKLRKVLMCLSSTFPCRIEDSNSIKAVEIGIEPSEIADNDCCLTIVRLTEHALQKHRLADTPIPGRSLKSEGGCLFIVMTLVRDRGKLEEIPRKDKL